ncbi:MAG: phospholipid carrier-dependent glycosyltransferase [Deltaproteobacteria bacterium]|nr:phospholipid carrier-dependent glycosyltransferase [Deltaproteobacteria bacterium]
MLSLLSLAAQALLIAAAFCGLGFLVLDALRAGRLDGGLGTRFAAGAMAASLTATIVAAWGLLNLTGARVLLIAVLALAAFGWWKHRARIGDLVSAVRSWRKEDGFMIAVLAVAAAPGFFLAAAPEVSRDALVYHLPMATRALETGSLAPIPGNVYSFFPMGAEMIFALLFSAFGERATAVFHWLSFVFCLGVVRSVSAARFGKIVAFWTALLIAATPVGMIVAGYAYVDWTLALFIAAAMAALWTFDRDGGQSAMIVAGTFAGFTVSVKYTGLTFAPIFFLFALVLAARKNRVRTGRLVGSFVAAGVVTGVPFLIRNLVLTGNPFFPFLFSLFGGSDWDAERAQSWAMFLGNFGMGRGPLDLMALPVRIALFGKFGSSQFDGMLGPVFLVLGVAAVLGGVFARRDLPAGSGLVALAAALAFITGTHQARFAIPLLIFLAPLAAAGLSFAFTAGHIRYIALSWALVLATAAGSAAAAYPELARIRPLGAATGSESDDVYYMRLVPAYGVYDVMNARLGPDDRVLSVLTGNLEYLFHVPHYSDAVIEDYTMRRILKKAAAPDDVLAELRERGFTHLFFNASFLQRSLSERDWKLLTAALKGRARLLARDGAFLLFGLP